MACRLIAVCITVIALSALAQNAVEVSVVAGAGDIHALADITRITFTDSTILFGGVDKTYEFESLGKLVFKESPDAVKHPAARPSNIQKNQVEIARSLNGLVIKVSDFNPGEIAIRIYRVNGQVVSEIRKDCAPEAVHTVWLSNDQIAGGALAKGVYMIHISTRSGLNVGHTINFMN